MRTVFLKWLSTFGQEIVRVLRLRNLRRDGHTPRVEIIFNELLQDQLLLIDLAVLLQYFLFILHMNNMGLERSIRRKKTKDPPLFYSDSCEFIFNLLVQIELIECLGFCVFLQQ